MRPLHIVLFLALALAATATEWTFGLTANPTMGDSQAAEITTALGDDNDLPLSIIGFSFPFFSNSLVLNYTARGIKGKAGLSPVSSHRGFVKQTTRSPMTAVREHLSSFAVLNPFQPRELVSHRKERHRFRGSSVAADEAPISPVEAKDLSRKQVGIERQRASYFIIGAGVQESVPACASTRSLKV